MKIAIDTRCIGNNNTDGYGYFLYEILKRITGERAQDEFLLIFDKPYHASPAFVGNVKCIVTGPATTNPLLLKLWYDVKLPGLLKKLKIDLFVTGPGICSLVTRIPQCMVIDDLSFLHFPSYIKKTELFFLRRYTKKFLLKADRIVTLSAFLENEITARYSVAGEKISVIHGSARSFHALTITEREEVRSDYADGKNYFLYTGEIDQRQNLLHLLKAFSIFKKRQKSDWKLVLAGSIDPRYKSFVENIKSYKYHNDVVIANHPVETEIIKLTAAAYACIYPSAWEGSGARVREALQCGVPVATSLKSAMAEIAGDAALYFDAADHRDIAEKMMLLYKDETLRNQLIEKGKTVGAAYSWDEAASLFWQAIAGTGR